MTVPNIIALASASWFQDFLLHKLKWSWIRRLRHAAMMLKASPQESPQTHWFCPTAKANQDLPSANWDSDAFFAGTLSCFGDLELALLASLSLSSRRFWRFSSSIASRSCGLFPWRFGCRKCRMHLQDKLYIGNTVQHLCEVWLKFVTWEKSWTSH